jgi:flagellar biosynthesis protein FlhB
MAEENQDGQEKTEQPTHKRQQDAKKKGQIARSRERAICPFFFASCCRFGVGCSVFSWPS